MKVDLANKNVTKLMMTGIAEPDKWRSTSPKIKDCPGLFHKALVNYYKRIEQLHKSVTVDNSRSFKVWYGWTDGIKINILNKNFGLLYTGSVIYGFKLEEEDAESNTLNKFEFEKYYIKGKSFLKRHSTTLFQLDFSSRQGIKIRGVWTGASKEWKDKSQKELWYHNLETLNKLRGTEGFCNEFVDGYSKAINEYLATL